MVILLPVGPPCWLQVGEHPLVLVLSVVSVQSLGASDARGLAAGFPPDWHQPREFEGSDLGVSHAISHVHSGGLGVDALVLQLADSR